MLLLLLSLKCLFNEISLLILQIRTAVCRLPPDFADQTVIRGSKCADYTRQQFNSKYTWSALAIVRLLYSFDVCWKSCAILIDYYYRWSWWRRRSERRRSDWLLAYSPILKLSDEHYLWFWIAVMCWYWYFFTGRFTFVFTFTSIITTFIGTSSFVFVLLLCVNILSTILVIQSTFAIYIYV
jgi:hypothetical protein